MNELHDMQVIFEKGTSGRKGYEPPALDVPEKPISQLLPEGVIRAEAPPLPEVSESEVVRHYTKLSRRNHGVDVGLYPLGSCTMKYNPKQNETAANMTGFKDIHPYQDESTVQGALELMFELEKYLAEIAGLDNVTLQPCAGAQGELTGLLIIRAYHQATGGKEKTEIICPDSAHGTNPASAAMAGFKIVQVASDARGGIDIDALKKAVGPNTAGLMLTNPNTLGLFDENIVEIARIIHDCGGLLYYDGANANAILGISRPGDMGFDVVHFNLHKTFSTPHGGGGPGSGPVAVRKELAKFLPVPIITKEEEVYKLDYDQPYSIGKLQGFYGNFGIMVRAYSYILRLGSNGLRRVSEYAVLHANYMMRRLQPVYHLPYDRYCKHEFVLSCSKQKAIGARALDIAKRLLDYGYHAPTVYFPMIVDEALMIEPTETEPKEEMDAFIEALIKIDEECQHDPLKVQQAPHNMVVGRLDEVKAARNLDLVWKKDN
jgi:glycine dehydrogenase subunit 2